MILEDVVLWWVWGFAIVLTAFMWAPAIAYFWDKLKQVGLPWGRK